ncbi:MAG: hypothetical protein M1821_002293 [Bathelium mastoideum]|nr:MAG: hypothetical protein M1821_002293 [Bathelium mastoideum]
MRFLESWWASLAYILDCTSISPFNDQRTHQTSLVKHYPVQNVGNGPVFYPHGPPSDNEILMDSYREDPIIKPPYPPGDKPALGAAIQCNYSVMGSQWRACNEPRSRGCWLRNDNGDEFNIKTNYESNTPIGVLRKYELNITTKALAPDGVPMEHGKVFNDQYPGPWIQACWGDQLEITVHNHLRFNGTTIHWHGIRQLNNTENDGVNAVTQCPIAPGQKFTYRFNATQYGSSWYHSHYSLQYADGLVGPMTIYGPSSDDYTYAEEPILMTDWNHRSAFEDWSYSLPPGRPRPLMTNILLNGKGRYVEPGTKEPVAETKRYTKILQKGARYLLRLINTSVDTTFVFAIDGHNLTVIGSDFVPLKTPYNTSSVLVGIGQRYHVILTAIPITPSKDDNYWIRTIPASGCGSENFVENGTYLLKNTGIIRYTNSKCEPTSTQAKISTNCSDEPYESLAPMVEWRVGEPSNTDVKTNRTFEVGLHGIQGHPYHPDYDRKLWAIDNLPLWLDMSEPTILNLNTPNGSWPTTLNVETHNPKSGDWIYLVITAPNGTVKDLKRPERFFAAVAHPIHLHGHDFAVLAQSNETYPGYDKLKLNKRNPPRRDVALLPTGGYLVIAFKADNPGTWLLHCHIAWHASSGLGMQILENTQKLTARLSENSTTRPSIVDTCSSWEDWVGDVTNHYDPKRPDALQDDSGI